MIRGHIGKFALGLACLVAAIVVPRATPAAACSCFGDAIQTAESVGPPDAVFTGVIVDSGPSDITEGFVLGEPGVAYLFEVDKVRVGELGATVVIHAPDGDGAGNCSIPRPNGRQFVAVRRQQGVLVGGLCSIFPIDRAPWPADLTAAFGPERAPDPSVEAEQLDPVVDTAALDPTPAGTAPLEAAEPEVVQDIDPLNDDGVSLRLVVGLVGVSAVAMLGGTAWAKRSA